MGVYGALLTGVTGLAGQSTKMGAISDNIANVNTVGYKKADIPFQSLVTDPFGRTTSYSPGGVLAKPRQLISQQGVITGTASATDMAISGRGFFIVSEDPAGGLDGSRFFTRAGSFRTAIDPNDPQRALLQNTGGFYLTGIPVEDRNNLPEPNTLVGLEPVDVNRLANTARATENVTTQANLAAEAQIQGAARTVYNADGTQKVFTTGTASDPDNVQVTAGTLVITKRNGETVNLTAADYAPNVTTAGLTASGQFAAGDAVDFDGNALSFNIAGNNVTISQADLALNGFTDGVNNAAALAGAINAVGTRSTGGVTYTLNAQLDGDTLTIQALNGGSQVSTDTITGIAEVGLDTPVPATVAGPPSTVTLTTTNPYADLGSVNFSGAVGATLDITLNGTVFSFDVAADLGLTDGVSSVGALVAAINGLPDQAVGGEFFDLQAAVAGNVLTVSANQVAPITTVTAGNVTAVAGITSFSGPTDVANADATGPATFISLSDAVTALNDWQETIRITTSAGGTDRVSTSTERDSVTGFPVDAVFSLSDGADQITIPAGTFGVIGGGPLPIPVTVADITVNDLITNINGLGAITSSAGVQIRLSAGLVGNQLSIKAVNATTNQPIALDPGSVSAEDFTINAVTPQVAADSEIDISAVLNGTTIAGEQTVSISATEGGARLDIDLTNLDVDGAGNGNIGDVISGSEGDWGTVFQSDLAQTQLIYDALGAPHNVQLQYVKRPDEANLWEVNLSDSNVTGFRGDPNSDDFDPDVRYDPTAANNNGARFVVQDDGNNTIETQRLFLKFNGDGSLAEVRTLPGGALDSGGTAFGQRGGGTTTGVVQNRALEADEQPKLITIAIGPAEVGLGSGDGPESIAGPINPVPNDGQPFGADGDTQTAEAVVYEWNVGRPTELPGSAAGTGLEGLTQFDSGESAPQIETNFYSQDGARLGNISGVSVDENGTLFALFDNGLVEPIYVLPVATFNAPDELVNYTGNIFAESGASGQVQVKRAGDQGAGDIIGSAVENSNVDLGDEFTDMIITQQSFTANTRVITTSDRMLEELVRILR